jgi:hypothetical protein
MESLNSTCHIDKRGPELKIEIEVTGVKVMED